MHRRTDTEDGEAEILAGTPASPSGPPLGPTVIPFRRADAAAIPGSAASDIPPMSLAPFVALGPIVQSVVLRIKDDRVRLKVLVPISGRGSDRDQFDELED